MESLDVVVIGAGIVGLAIARELALAGREVVVLEQHATFGTETSSRNSEVIHAGIYYPVGSLKARSCVRGKALLYAYCDHKQIAHQRLGKLIVATNSEEQAILDDYSVRAQANGVRDLVRLNAEAVATLEPALNVTSALMSPSTGIVDSHALQLNFIGDIEAHRGTVVYRSPVLGGVTGKQDLCIDVGGEERITVAARSVVNAGGLHAASLAAKLGVEAKHIPPSRYAIGHYYALTGRNPFRHLVYPVARGGGLGVHVTLDLAGQARFGPDVRWQNHLDYTFDDSAREKFIVAIQRYYPLLDPQALQPAYTGIRPKLVGPGDPPADFRIDGPVRHGIPGLVNLFGIESPGLTAAMAIAEHVAHKL